MSKTVNGVSFGAPFCFSINGVGISNTKLVDFSSTFKLEQVFCSCPIFLPKEEIGLEVLDSSCPCTEGKVFVRHLTEQELNHYKRKIPD